MFMDKCGNLLVSAFFDIGRGNVDIKGMKRDVNKYFDYFEHWARIKNDLVVYTQPDFVEKVYDIRNRFGLRDKTFVVAVNDISLIEPEIYKKMKKIEKDDTWKGLRLHIKAMSNMADYDYIMLLKYWCLQDAVKRMGWDGQISWIDFGFDHGGKVYYGEDFDFEWVPSLDSYIHLFVLNNPTGGLLRSLLLQCDSIMGCLIVTHSSQCEKLWDYCTEAMRALMMLGTIDDDQQLLLMAYNEHSDDFCIHYSNWFLPIKEFGGEHLRIRKDEHKEITAIVRLKNLKGKVNIAYKRLKRDYTEPTPYNYGKRMEKIAKEEE